jgi:hypothetical protein
VDSLTGRVSNWAAMKMIAVRTAPSNAPSLPPITLIDEFGQTTPLVPSNVICVPTVELGITPTSEDSWGRIKVLYR